jgi:CheY-like chemotaxis protein
LPYDKVSANNLSIINDTENFEENKVLRSLKILIVEDDKVIEKIITLKIEKYSKEILWANNGLDAFRICKNNLDIDLILMDIKLPIMDGYDTIRQIRKFNAGVIIFAQTAYTFDNDRQKAFDAGCNEFITKPYERYIIEKLIEEYFKK